MKTLLTTSYCGGCGPQPVESCIDSLSRAGIGKVHWECWANCNLRCDFCFRTEGGPLRTAEAMLLIQAVRTGGAEALVFAGGDPTLRRDLPMLIEHATAIGLRVIVHTNGHKISQPIWTSFSLCDHIGLSLDGPTAEVHDAMRGRQGNFSRVLQALQECTANHVPVSVRTVVSSRNAENIADIGRIIERNPCVRRWKLLEFTAVERGWDSRADHQVSSDRFTETVLRARASYAGSAPLETLTTSEKIGGYMMVSPSGLVYGFTPSSSVALGRHQFLGAINAMHLCELASRIHIDTAHHERHLHYLS